MPFFFLPIFLSLYILWKTTNLIKNRPVGEKPNMRPEEIDVPFEARILLEDLVGFRPECELGRSSS